MNHETCFILLTPETRRRGLVGEIIHRFERAGLYPQGLMERYKTERWVAQMFGATTPAFADVWTEGPIIGFGVTGPRACMRVDQIDTQITVDFLYRDEPIHVASSELEATRMGELFYDVTLDQRLNAA